MRVKLTSRCLLWLAVAGVVLSTQADLSAQQTSANATLAGIVIKDPGSEPVKKAVVELIAMIAPNESGSNYTALTGTDGGFRVENILPGRYRMFVERPGYQEIDKHRHRMEGRFVTLIAGQELKELVIRLQASAVVEGRVTDEDGDPMPEAQVTVFHQTFAAGRSRWEQSGAERTNDLGDYRIANLAAGNYFVSVTPPPDFRSLIETASIAPRRSDAAPDKTTPIAYQTTYYPGARDRSQAASIQLHAGDEFPMNFSLTPSPSLTIRGSVANLPSGSTAAIMLQSKDFSLVLNGAEMHKDGSFEIRDVAPGAYTIVATVENAAAPMIARQSLQVTESVDSIRLAPQVGSTIRGRLRMEANSGARPDPSQMFLLLRASDEGDSSSTVSVDASAIAQVHTDGSFEWKDIPPGNYSVRISDSSVMPDWFLKSAAANGRDVTASGFSVNGGASTLDIVVSGNGAGVEGVAVNAKDEPVADAVVVAVPEMRFRSHFDRFQKAVADQSGHFRLRGLPPGEYTVFAWESVDGEAYYNPEFLKNYEGQGKTVRVSEGEHASLPLKTIPEAEDQQ
jgi:hypothetical protein